MKPHTYALYVVCFSLNQHNLQISDSISCFNHSYFGQIRFNITGRIVPQHTLEEIIAMVPRSIEILAPLVDFFAELHNAPNTTDVALVTKGMTWGSFRRVWIQPPTATTEYPLSLNSTAMVETVLKTNTFCDSNDDAHIDAVCDDQGEPWCTRLP